MLACHDLTKTWGSHRAVDRLGFTILPGEIVALLGPNGAGKTTCMRMLAGTLEADAGRIDLFGLSMQDQRHALQAMTGFLPEGAPVQPDLTAREHLAFIAGVRCVPRRERANAIAEAAAEADIVAVLDMPVRQLSKGFRRRVALAGVLVGAPQALLLDEPTDGLDPNQKQAVRALLRELSPSRVILISTHALDEAVRLCDRVIVIDRGRVQADEPVATFAARGDGATTGPGAIAALETAFAALTTGRHAGA